MCCLLTWGYHVRSSLTGSQTHILTIRHSVGAGLFFATFNVPYALMGLAMGPLSRKFASKVLRTYINVCVGFVLCVSTNGHTRKESSLLRPAVAFTSHAPPYHTTPRSQTLITHGVLLEAGGLLLLGPPPPLTRPAAAAASSTSSSGWPKLIAAWVMTVMGMMCMGTGQGLIAMPAVDAMRTTIIERQRGHDHHQQQQFRQHQLAARSQEGDGAEEGEEEEITPADGRSADGDGSESVSSRNGEGAMDEELASVMSFTISLGAFAGPMLGGLGIQYLPHTREWGCPVLHPPGGRFGMGGSNEMEGEEMECVSGYRWTTLVLSALILTVWALLYWHTRAPARAAATVKGSRGQTAEDGSVPPPVVVLPVKGMEEPVAVNDALGAQGDGGYGHFFVHDDEHQEEEGGGGEEAGARHCMSLHALALEAQEAALVAEGRGPLRA